MNNFASFCNMENYVPAPNLSKGFHGVLIEYLKKYYNAGDSLLLIAENSNVNYIFEKALPGAIIHNNEYSGSVGEKFVDLNIRIGFKPSYNLVLSQALLEHVCRPCVALENMADITKAGGHIFIHTQNPIMPYHAYPVDCLRFFLDWFLEMQKYLPVKLVEWDTFGPHLFAGYERL